MNHQQLITQTSSLLTRSREISRLKGENFNIFSVLRIERDEVTTHNRFIAHLLNPKGSHGMGSVFLNLFYDQLLLSENNEVVISNDAREVIQKMRGLQTSVKAEYWLGNIDSDITKGGSIDVCISSSLGQIRIENKIDAGEQKNQLERYYHSKRRTDQNILVFYLTLNGKKATSARNLKNGENYFCLSHKTDTTKWLEACLLQASDQPILRETIKQYLILIKKLTHQTTSQEMNKELQELISRNSKNFESAEAISKTVEDSRTRIYKSIFKLIETEVLRLLDVNVKVDNIRGSRTDGGFISLKPIVIDEKKYDIGINLELGNNYFFFCMAPHNKKRDTNSNNSDKFNDVAEFLSIRDYSCKLDKGRNGWSLYKVFCLSEKFSFLQYLDFSDIERENLIKNIANDIARTIEESKVTDFTLIKQNV